MNCKAVEQIRTATRHYAFDTEKPASPRSGEPGTGSPAGPTNTQPAGANPPDGKPKAI